MYGKPFLRSFCTSGCDGQVRVVEVPPIDLLLWRALI